MESAALFSRSATVSLYSFLFKLQSHSLNVNSSTLTVSTFEISRASRGLPEAWQASWGRSRDRPGAARLRWSCRLRSPGLRVPAGAHWSPPRSPQGEQPPGLAPRLPSRCPPTSPGYECPSSSLTRCFIHMPCVKRKANPTSNVLMP